MMAMASPTRSFFTRWPNRGFFVGAEVEDELPEAFPFAALVFLLFARGESSVFRFRL